MFSLVGPMMGLGTMNVFLTVGLGIMTVVAALVVPAVLWGVNREIPIHRRMRLPNGTHPGPRSTTYGAR